ncbi:MAG: nuclear transport factor 2 family protein [Actinomycetales bacterium]|nr:MAG: nuclear transport factor 2 family protein [Actinomycetales bacterium]
MIGRLKAGLRRRREARDRSEIWALQVRYAGACDRADLAAIEGCFAPNAQCTYNGERLTPGRSGVREYLLARAALMSEAGTPDFAIHLVANVEVEFDRASAHAWTYGVRYVGRTTDAGQVLETRGLVYDDVLVRQEGVWMVQQRELRALWDTAQPA